MLSFAIIPARGGSKGIPGKNTKILLGKPLIAYTIEASLASQVDYTIVSTDDAHIAEIARQYGARVVERPAELAHDTAPTEPALIHAVLEFERQIAQSADVVVLLQCTSPLRAEGPINACLEKLQSGTFDSVLTCGPDRHFHWEEVGGIGVAQYDYKNRPRRQDITRLFFNENGAVYAAYRDILVNGGNRLGDNIGIVPMPEEDSLEIDEEFDFFLAEQILTYRREKGR